MQEGDPALTDADPWRLVNRSQAGRDRLTQCRFDIRHRVGNMVQAGSVTGHELADRGVGAERA